MKLRNDAYGVVPLDDANHAIVCLPQDLEPIRGKYRLQSETGDRVFVRADRKVHHIIPSFGATNTILLVPFAAWIYPRQ